MNWAVGDRVERTDVRPRKSWPAGTRGTIAGVHECAVSVDWDIGGGDVGLRCSYAPDSECIRVAK